jgi:hypothetical protein
MILYTHDQIHMGRHLQIVRFGSLMDAGSAMPSMAILAVGPYSTAMAGPVLGWRHVFTKRLRGKKPCA